ncbi:hypothetical protein BGZ95_003550 [Linnemannia exigua]|uniref:F-box domain-containing protein n=1 Tax=Linnemannia exigua TaxID=604196 RepID=A0AAD4D4F2_9FUNG|nr:hypothetical protein BGZ95_003550 [Linnemannia exigua]
MTTIKRIRLVLHDPSDDAPSSSTPLASSSAEITSASAPPPLPSSTSDAASALTLTAANADTSTDLAGLLQSRIGLTVSSPLTATTTGTTTRTTIPAPMPAPPTLLPTFPPTSLSTADVIMETLAGIYGSGANPSMSNNNSNSTVGTSAGSTTVPSSEAGTVSKKRSRKGKERAEDLMGQQIQQPLIDGTKAKRRRKAVSQDGDTSSSASPKKRGRPRKDLKVSAKESKGKGKGRAKDSADPNNLTSSTQSDPANVKNAKGGGDSEFETDDDMVEIISTRIPHSLKSKVVMREKHVRQDNQEDEGAFNSSSGEESNHEGHEGHDHIEMQQAGEPSSSTLDAGHSEVISVSQTAYSIFPTEILQQILLCLPLSKIARHSRVSKAWLDAARVLPVWKEACKKAKLGDPRKKYKTHMALVCANSYWICERCMSFSKGREHYADLPLPVEDEEDDHLVWMLCLACRIEYFERHPEPLKENKVYRHEFAWVVQTRQLGPNAVFLNYALRGENLHGVQSTGRADTRRQLFDRAAVQRRALEVHGGWIGVDACATNPGRKRAAVCNERAKECRLFKKKPLTKKRPPVPEEKKAARKEALEQRRTAREEARQENERQRLLWNRVARLGKRHKWHTTTNWKKNRYY